ncbi:hypothetical protein [Parasitella parasitica]|uniref:Retrotransposon gag domain-containing protein n=1 Tax=Parasitella parasitica TaxID=35722 RepID=A0A0B7N7J7_9FUNG|nr:hypothetical protein [Parasitella parasitica]
MVFVCNRSPSSISKSNDRLPTVGLPLSEEKVFSGENSSILSSEEVAPMNVNSLAASSSTISENVLNNESRDHYDNVPPVDSRESHGQSTRVDFDTAIKQRSIFDASHNNLGSDKRRYLSCEIASLNNQLFNAVMQGITHYDTKEEAKRLTAVTLILEKAEKAFKMLFGKETNLVPGETPLFQWKGHVFNKNKPIFRTVEDCLDQFERVLFAHQLSLEDNWRRLVLPARLSTSMARWYAQYLSHSQFESWSRFRLEVSNKYGKSQHNIEEEA